MVTGFIMESRNKRMCKTESGCSGVTVDYNHRAYDEECFGDFLNMFDFPMESLEGDGFAEDWALKLGPIPSEVFKEIMPQAPQIGVADLPFDYPLINNSCSQIKYEQNLDEETFKHCQIGKPKQDSTFVEDKKVYPSQASPNSVLESSNGKGVAFGTEISIPVRTRNKRLRPATNPWLHSSFLLLHNNECKIRKPPQDPVLMKTKRSFEDITWIKKCAHCEITKTPQWREGPMGPKTLCNACGVRYRSGRLYPEYRPAASPTFVPALHSNSHRKVIEMRQKVVK